jgi:hypothetical protein
LPYADLAAELATEVRLLRAVQAEQKPHQQAREDAYLKVQPDELARTLPGIAEVGAPMLVAAMGRPQRFASAAKFKAFTGLTPKASETGETDRKGQAITKAGAARLRKQLVCSANTARQVDPQLAAVYHAQMVERGAHHIKALCVVAGQARRAVLDRADQRGALCAARRRRPPGHRRGGPPDHRRALHGARGGPPPAPLHQAPSGEGPAARPERTCPAWHQRCRTEATFPRPILGPGHGTVDR